MSNVPYRRSSYTYGGTVVVPAGRNYIGSGVPGTTASKTSSSGSGRDRVVTVEPDYSKDPVRYKGKFMSASEAISRGMPANYAANQLGLETAEVTDLSRAGQVYVQDAQGSHAVPLTKSLQGIYNAQVERQNRDIQKSNDAYQAALKDIGEQKRHETIAYATKKQELAKQGYKEGADGNYSLTPEAYSGVAYWQKQMGYEKRQPSSYEQKQLGMSIGIPVLFKGKMEEPITIIKSSETVGSRALRIAERLVKNEYFSRKNLAEMGKAADVVGQDILLTGKEVGRSLLSGINEYTQPTVFVRGESRLSFAKRALSEAEPITRYIKRAEQSEDVKNLGLAAGLGIVIALQPELAVPIGSVFTTQAIREKRPLGEIIFIAGTSLLPEMTKTAEAGKVLRAAAKEKPTSFTIEEIPQYKNVPPFVILGKQNYYAGGNLKEGIINPSYVSTTYKITKPSEPIRLIRSFEKVEQEPVNVPLKKPIGIQTNKLIGVITPEGKQYMLREFDFNNKRYFIRSITEKGGETTVGVFKATGKGAKLLGEFKGETTPDLVFGTPRKLASQKELISMPERLREQVRTSYRQKGVSLVEPKLFKKVYSPTAKGEILVTQDLVSATKALSNETWVQKPFTYDLATGELKPVSAGTTVRETTYKFVKKFVEPEARQVSHTGAEIFYDAPATTLVKQKITRNGVYVVKYEELKPTILKDLSDFLKGKQSRRGEILVKKEIKSIQRPSVRVGEFGSFELSTRLPRSESEFKASFRELNKPATKTELDSVLNIKMGYELKPSIREDIINKIELKPMSELKSKIETKVKEDVILQLKPAIKSELKSQTKNEVKLQQKMITEVVNRIVPRPTTRTSFELTPPPIPLIPLRPTKMSKSSLLTNVLIKKKVRAYQAFLKLKGKFIAIGSPVSSKESALDIGVSASKSSLAATFKVMEVQNKNPLNLPSTGAFQRFKSQLRSYKISQGRRIPLVDTYIEQRGTRLSTRAERVSIQKSKRGRRKWL